MRGDGLLCTRNWVWLNRSLTDQSEVGIAAATLFPALWWKLQCGKSTLGKTTYPLKLVSVIQVVKTNTHCLRNLFTKTDFRYAKIIISTGNLPARSLSCKLERPEIAEAMLNTRLFLTSTSRREGSLAFKRSILFYTGCI
jgi:hypothetical protein